MMKQPEFGKKIARRRIELGLTQEELADKSRLSVRSVQRIENGKVNPRSYTIHMLDKVLDIKKGIYYQEKVEHLKDFLEHLTLFAIINGFIYIIEAIDRTTRVELHKFTIIWGFFLALHAAEIFFERYLGTSWNEKMIFKYMHAGNLFSGFKKTVYFKLRMLKPIKKLLFSGIAGLLILWYIYIGYHRHYVIINKGPLTVKIKSTESRFEFSIPDHKATMMNEYAINQYTTESESGKPFNINGHGIITSKQIIHLPDSVTEYRFAINHLDFILKNNNLYQDSNNWYLRPNEPLILHADRMQSGY